MKEPRQGHLPGVTEEVKSRVRPETQSATRVVAGEGVERRRARSAGGTALASYQPGLALPQEGLSGLSGGSAGCRVMGRWVTIFLRGGAERRR